MIYILIVFYSIAGQQHSERSEHDSYSQCTAAKQVWLRQARQLWLEQAEAHCVVQMRRPD